MKATDPILWRKNPKGAEIVKDAPKEAPAGAIDVPNRRATFVLSTAKADRYGDTIAQDGWDLDNYKSNPVVLCNHLSMSLPIGKCVEIGVVDGQLKGTVEFAKTAAAEDVWLLVQDGVLRATSVGFKPKEYTEDAERTGPWGWPALNFKKQELLEWSVVGIPANPDCTLDDKAKGVLERVLRSLTGTPPMAPVTRSVGGAPVRKGNSHGMSKEFEAHFAKAEAAKDDLEKSLKACRALHNGDAPEPDDEPEQDDALDTSSEADDPDDGDKPEAEADKSFDDMSDAELVETLKGPRGPELQRVMAERAATLKRQQAGKLD